MKTKNTKLCLIKNAVLELNDDQLNTVNGGTVTSITPPLISVAVEVAIDATIQMGIDMAHNWFHGDD